MKKFLNILQKIIAEHGENIFNDSRMFKTIFLDYNNSDLRGEMELLCKVIDLRAYNLIANTNNLEVEKKNLKHRLHNDYYVDEKMSNNIIEIFATAIRNDNIKQSNINTQAQTYYNNLFDAYSQGRLPFENGYIISGFIGNSNYTIYEITYYNRVTEIYQTGFSKQDAQTILEILK